MNQIKILNVLVPNSRYLNEDQLSLLYLQYEDLKQYITIDFNVKNSFDEPYKYHAKLADVKSHFLYIIILN